VLPALWFVILGVVIALLERSTSWGRAVGAAGLAAGFAAALREELDLRVEARNTADRPSPLP
jgi:ubiquinone biosynthesis protein